MHEQTPTTSPESQRFAWLSPDEKRRYVLMGKILKRAEDCEDDETKRKILYSRLAAHMRRYLDQFGYEPDEKIITACRPTE